MRKGKFITFEGIDGAGKSTHLAWFQQALSEYLNKHQQTFFLTREPGGTALGEALRELVIHQTMSLETEALLMFAARAEHIEKVIRPRLERGEWVLSDRFSDASFAYQGGGKGLSNDRLRILEEWVQQGLQPDLTILFDLDPAVAEKRRSHVRKPDKFEQQDLAFFQRVRDAYLARAKAEPNRFCVIDAQQNILDIQKQLSALIEQITAQ